MANLPQSLSLNALSDSVPTPANPNAVVAAAAAAAGRAGANKDRKMASANQLLLDLSNPELRENTLLELREKYFKIWLPCCGIRLVLLMHTGDSFDIPCSLLTKPDYCTVKPSLQCSCTSSVCNISSRHKDAISQCSNTIIYVPFPEDNKQVEAI